MSENPSSLLFETVRLADTLRRNLSGGSKRGGDVWSEATREDRGRRFATGSAECCVCPVCRAIAVSRDAGPDMFESLATAARKAVAAYDRSRREGPRS